jgi:hypothetical protein
VSKPARVSAASLSLSALCGEAIVVAHTEDTSPLVATLSSERFGVREVRGPYTDEQRTYSPNVRCLVNHANAWSIAAERERPTVVVEADFVPVVGFGDLGAPFPYRADPEPLFGWLYAGCSILYGIDADGFPYGHGSTMVAYVLNAAAARALLDFFGREMSRPSPGTYSRWDTYLGVYLRWERGTRNYIPVYQYGEHGGIANPEHKAVSGRWWHEADVLRGPLAFLPIYARGSRWRYRARRLRGWARGVVRVLTLRYYDPRHVNDEAKGRRIAMGWLALARSLKLASPPEPLVGLGSASR